MLLHPYGERGQAGAERWMETAAGGGDWAPWERQEEVCQSSYQCQQGKASREGTWHPRVIRVAVWRLAKIQRVGSELVRIEYVGLLLVCAGGGTLVYPCELIKGDLISL